MKKQLAYIICTLLAITFISCQGKRNAIPPLEETYSKKDVNPFGAYVLHQQLEQYFIHNSINDTKTSFEKSWQKMNDTAAVYISISRRLFLSRKDVNAMLAYVYDGNSMFISSDQIETLLLDTLGCSVKSNTLQDHLMPELKYTSVELTPPVNVEPISYQYFYIPFYNHFSKLNKTQAVVLGKNNFGPNYIVVYYGKGRFYLHTEPRALSNYFLLQKDNNKYFQDMFSYTPSKPQHVYWDDYYNKRNYRPAEGGDSTFSVLFKYPAMKWSFWILFLLLLLYIFFAGKRRQRVVEAIPANTNTTIAFTETIGRLYLQKKDNRNIADKLITYFQEQIRNQYFLNTSLVNDEFIATLARKSNNTQEKTEGLFATIREIQQSGNISDELLLSLNQQIENFNKSQL
ncbi:hypothetical protein BH11BAC3_BH11BAC3_45600 [soil metagenome]